jgi:hypothetical protein
MTATAVGAPFRGKRPRVIWERRLMVGIGFVAVIVLWDASSAASSEGFLPWEPNALCGCRCGLMNFIFMDFWQQHKGEESAQKT